MSRLALPVCLLLLTSLALAAGFKPTLYGKYSFIGRTDELHHSATIVHGVDEADGKFGVVFDDFGNLSFAGTVKQSCPGDACATKFEATAKVVPESRDIDGTICTVVGDFTMRGILLKNGQQALRELRVSSCRRTHTWICEDGRKSDARNLDCAGTWKESLF